MAAGIEIGSRVRAQPPPPHVVFEALTLIDRDPSRPWLHLLDDEMRPQVCESVPSSLVVWSSLWTKRPDAVVRFDLAPHGGSGCALRWTLLVDEPVPDDALVGHLRKRMNRLINADLRYTFGQ